MCREDVKACWFYPCESPADSSTYISNDDGKTGCLVQACTHHAVNKIWYASHTHSGNRSGHVCDYNIR